ncbi:MAG TPA: histidine phosphatase family protein [Acidimicrobiales bacterium]|jgi:probable phosphoglycerate mutase
MDATVFLVRHGRTALNAADILRGRGKDSPLDATGAAEVSALGKLFADCDVELIITSPLTRARQTAAAIAATTGASIELDDGLADREYGPWAGQDKTEVERRFGSLDAAPGVETVAQVVARAVPAIERAADRAARHPIVVVAHDAVNTAVLTTLVPALGAPDDIPQETGCWNRLERSGERWTAPVIGAEVGEPADRPR